MEKKEILERLREKLDRNNEAFHEEWLNCSKSTIAAKSREILATNIAYNELYAGGYPADYLEYLLRFDNPLEVVRDNLIEETNLSLDEDMSHALWSIVDKRDAKANYKLDEEYAPQEIGNEAITVRDFLKKHPEDNIEMMTPGGYVSLTPARTRALFSGDSVKGHPGDPAYSMNIPAKELLDQFVAAANYMEHTWHLLTDYEPELAEEPVQGGQEMSM